MSKIYKLSEFSGADFAEQINVAMAALKEDEGSTLVIEPGEYLLTTEMAREAQANVMSGAWGENPQDVMFTPEYKYSVGINFFGHKGTKVIGYGAKIMVDGFMEIVSMSDCEDCLIEGITIDHKRKPFSLGKVTNCTVVSDKEAYMDVKLYDDYLIQPKTPINMRYFVYNPETDRLEWPDLYAMHGEVIDERTIRYTGKYFKKDIEGLDIYIWHTYHSRPAVLIQRSKNPTVRNVTVHSHPGMGITGNRSENILIDGFRDIPAEGLQLSTNTDATHFTACMGDLVIKNCTLIGQGDDGTNVHSYYHTVIEKDGCRIVIKNEFPDGIAHTQTPDYPLIGDTLEVSLLATLESLGTRTVTAVTPIGTDGRVCEVILDQPLPDSAPVNESVVLCTDRLPRLFFVNNYCRGNFSRGVLAKTRFVRINNNVFENIMSTPICAYAEAAWREGAVPANIDVMDNVVRNCAHLDCPGGIGGIDIGVSAKKDAKHPVVDRAVIMANYINSPGTKAGVRLNSVAEIFVCENKILSSKDDIILKNCHGIETQGFKTM